MTVYQELELKTVPFFRYKKLVQEALEVYKMLIIGKSIPIVQEVYKNIIIDSEYSLATLTKSSQLSGHKPESEHALQVKTKETKGLKMIEDAKNAETCLLFNMNVFSEIANAKNNLILVSVLFFLRNLT